MEILTFARMLIANKVTSLTAARYFAARGAEWIVYDLSHDRGISVQEIQAINAWVEGPSCAIYLPLGQDPEGYFSKIQSQGVVLGHYAGKGDYFPGIVLFKEWVINGETDWNSCIAGASEWPDHTIHIFRLEDENGWNEASLTHLEKLHLSNIVLTSGSLHYPWDIIRLRKWGICITAPMEDQTGVADFEAIDRIIDHMEAIAE